MLMNGMARITKKCKIKTKANRERTLCARGATCAVLSILRSKTIDFFVLVLINLRDICSEMCTISENG